MECVNLYTLMKRDLPCKGMMLLLSTLSSASLVGGLYGMITTSYPVFTFLTIIGVAGVLTAMILLILTCIGACLSRA
jgi:hypothetical protein